MIVSAPWFLERNSSFTPIYNDGTWGFTHRSHPWHR